MVQCADVLFSNVRDGQSPDVWEVSEGGRGLMEPLQVVACEPESVHELGGCKVEPVADKAGCAERPRIQKSEYCLEELSG